MDKNNIQIFEQEEFGQVRTIEIDGKIYFLATDITEVLEYKNGSRDVKRHVDEEDILKMPKWYFNGLKYRDGAPIKMSSKGNKNTLVVNESGLYCLILHSQLPKAKKFKHWVTSVVLPTIRKTGSYNAPPQITEKTTLNIESLNITDTYIEDKPKSSTSKNYRKGDIKIMTDIKELLVEMADTFGATPDKRAGRNMYTCPECHSGEHGIGSTGAMSISRKNGVLVYHCFACGRGGTAIDMYANHYGMPLDTKEDIAKVIEDIKKDFNIYSDEDFNNFKKSYTFKSPINPQDILKEDSKTQKDYTNFFNYVLSNQLSAIEYLRKVRGLKYADYIAKTFQIGFSPNYAYEFENNKPSKSTPAVIIPLSKYSYAWRSITEPLKKKKGRVYPVNFNVLQDVTKKYIFFVEGEFDCFSILDISYDTQEYEFSSISVNSANNLPTFIGRNAEALKDKTIIISLDNDNKGIEWANKGYTVAQKNCIPCIIADVFKMFLGCKDSNEALLKNRDEFQKALIKEVEKAKTLDIDTYLKECERINSENNTDIPLLPELNAENIITPQVLEYMYTLSSEIDVVNFCQHLKDRSREFKRTKDIEPLISAYKKEALKRISQKELEKARAETPEWVYLDERYKVKIDERKYCAYKTNQLACRTINGRILTLDGEIDEPYLEQLICNEISQYINQDLAPRTKKIISALKILSYSPQPKPDTQRIHFKNGTYNISTQSFEDNKYWCINRIVTNYNKNAQSPIRWLNYLNDLLNPEDITTLQEFCGYCLIPTCKAQVMLFLVGPGGEGKSIIGAVLRALLGSENINDDKIHELQSNRFKVANCENKLINIDDDLNFKALDDTGLIKSVVVGEPISVEHKGEQAYNISPYCKLLAFGNGTLTSLYDHSNGFYRRQIIINTKPKPINRIDNPYLADEIKAELEGILLWCLEGLHRLISHDFKMFVSQASIQAMEHMKSDALNIIEWLKQSDEVQFNTNHEETSIDIYNNYCRWCYNNALKPLQNKTALGYLKDHAELLNIKSSENIFKNNKRARGFKGIQLIQQYTYAN